MREEHRGQKSDPQLESFLHEDAELTVEDADAILTASSVRMSLVIMRSLRGSNPELFRAVCETLIDLLQKSSKLALSHVKANSPQAETLNSITQFAREVVTTATGGKAKYSSSCVLSSTCCSSFQLRGTCVWYAHSGAL